MAESTEQAPTIVITARHGERQDYIMKDAGQNWVSGADRPWDPPLSEHGKEQGVKLGEHLAKELQLLELPPLSAIYTSPFLRCRQTAVGAMLGFNSSKDESVPPVRIEHGLAESINENWYRSWSFLALSDGAWGFRPPTEDAKEAINPATLHPASKQPVQTLLDWKAETAIGDCDVHSLDLEYSSVTTLDVPYCFHPSKLESRQDQRRRMLEVVTKVAQPEKTVLLISHGGPITHLYEEMTGNHWSVHGESSYCCYSIYRHAPGSGKEWEPLFVNQSNYLHEKLTFERHVSEGA
jgi:broad specificity phosphatase PhoE